MRSDDAGHVLTHAAPDPSISLERLTARLAGLASPDELALIERAYWKAWGLHEQQRRASGELYFVHLYQVADILVSLGADAEMIAAGFLHDSVEDTDYSFVQMGADFGKNIALLVEGVTKLGKFSFSSKQERQAENFRRMFLAMAKDIRVLVVKLADRLHNMRTLSHLPENKQRDIAKETLEIFAPLAHRLGIGRIKWELEDEALKYLHPQAYKEIAQQIAQKRDAREHYIQEVISRLQAELTALEIKCEISGRPKHFYSIYQKLVGQQKEFHELYDVTALRVIVESEKECYEVLGIVHAIWRPIPGRFKDYIAMPKPNLYQSLHTSVMGPEGRPLEVQIRTHDMHRVAEYGIAAHWIYKDKRSKGSRADLQLTWLRQMLDWQNDLKDAEEYLDTVKVDLFSDEVFTFTPQGDVIDLPVGSTPVDFAYRIHTDVGHRCIGAKVNGRIVTLNTRLQNGDIAEILTSKIKQPSLDWLNFVATSQAKNRIRQWFKKERRDDNIQRGKDLLEAELGRVGLEQLLKSDRFLEIAQKLNYPNAEDLLAAVGYGEVTLHQIMSRLRPEAPPDLSAKVLERPEPSPERKGTNGVLVGGETGMLVQFSKCCAPVPGDPIIGRITRGRGVTIHSVECPNVTSMQEDRLVPVSWGSVEKTSFPVELEIKSIDRMGLLKDILAKLSDTKTNIRSANVSTHRDRTATIGLVVEVQNLDHLQKIMTTISRISDVLSVSRHTRHRHHRRTETSS